MAGGEMEDETGYSMETIASQSQKLQDDLQKLGLKIKHHEDHLKFLKTQINNLEESMRDLQVSVLRFYSSTGAAATENNNNTQTEDNTVEQILQQENTAAAALYQLKTHHETQASNSLLTKDVLGVVATLGKVHDDNLSRLFSEYLGLETMLAIVCKTHDGIKALEMRDREGAIDKSAGVHGLGTSLGRSVDGRFPNSANMGGKMNELSLSGKWALSMDLKEVAAIIFNVIPYTGKFTAGDPQKTIALLKPRLPDGEHPPGFIGFAVNMINVEATNLYGVTASGHGLRETLFYHLFSRLQVYRTRSDIRHAAPCISDGAISLDGGMLKSPGMFLLGSRKDVNVRFPVSSGIPYLHVDILEAEEQIKRMKWEKQRIEEDMKREEESLNDAKSSFDIKRQEFMKFLRSSASLMTQVPP
ncbi:hypothetical protein ACLOJK_010271 [Asimina triloba]